MKEISKKKANRAHRVLMGIVTLYIETGKPIGSNTLRECGLDDLSAATIRNYFSQLEKEGFLTQPHASGGRVPTEQAYRLYATETASESSSEIESQFKEISSKEISTYLQQITEQLSETTGCATFLSSVRFDHDFILDVKLVSVDTYRTLCVIITDFGQILTEVLTHEVPLTQKTLEKVQTYLQKRLKGEKVSLSGEDAKVARHFYNEIMVRYIVRYSNFSDEEIHRTGFARLLAFPEFSDPVALATGLSLFESPTHMRLLLGDCVSSGKLRFWIGNDLAPYSSTSSACSVIAIPYHINQVPAGAIGILGPTRLPYPKLFGTLELFSQTISQALTKTLYKFKLSFRHPRSGTAYLQKEENKLLEIKDSHD